MIGEIRIILENVLCQLKHFRILAERIRHDLDICHDVIAQLSGQPRNRRRKQFSEIQICMRSKPQLCRVPKDDLLQPKAMLAYSLAT